MGEKSNDMQDNSHVRRHQKKKDRNRGGEGGMARQG